MHLYVLHWQHYFYCHFVALDVQSVKLFAAIQTCQALVDLHTCSPPLIHFWFEAIQHFGEWLVKCGMGIMVLTFKEEVVPCNCNWYIHCHKLCSLGGEYILCICSWLGINTSAMKHSQCWYKEYVGRNSWVPITRAAKAWKYSWKSWCIQFGRRVGRNVWTASSLGRLHTLSSYVQAHSEGGSSTHQSLNEPALDARRQHYFTSTEISITHF